MRRLILAVFSLAVLALLLLLAMKYTASGKCVVTVVYPLEGGAKLAEKLSRALEVRVCTSQSVEGLGNLDPVLYPAVIGGKDSREVLARLGPTLQAGNHVMLHPLVSLRLAREAGLKPIFLHKSRVEIHYYRPLLGMFSSLNMSMVKRLIEDVTLTEPSNVTIASATIRAWLPYMTVYTDLNLTRLLSYPRRSGAYVNYNAWLVSRLLSLSTGHLVPIVAPYKPNVTEPLVVLGPENASTTVYVFVELWCPFSARFFATTVRKLAEDAVSGRIRLVVASFIVHGSSELVRLHDALACYSKRVPPLEAFNTTLTLFYYMLEGVRPTLAMLSNLTGLNTSTLYMECSGASLDSTREARLLGITGVPAVAIVPKTGNASIILLGYHDYKVLERILRLVSS